MSTFTLTTLNTKKQKKIRLAQLKSCSNPALTNLPDPPVIKTLGIKKWLKAMRLSKCFRFFSEMTFDNILDLEEQKIRAQLSPGAAKKIIRSLKEVKNHVQIISEMKQNLILNGERVLPDALTNLLIILPSQFETLLGPLPTLFMDVMKIIYLRIPNMEPDITKHDAQNTFYKLLLHANQCASFTKTNKISLKKWRLEYKSERERECSLQKKSVAPILWK